MMELLQEDRNLLNTCLPLYKTVLKLGNYNKNGIYEASNYQTLSTQQRHIPFQKDLNSKILTQNEYLKSAQ